MTSHLIETIPSHNMHRVDEIDTGFPFEDRADRTHQFQSELDDIAKRYPEFAGHLNPLQQAQQQRAGRSQQEQEAPNRTRGHESHQDPYAEFGRFRRPFGSRFEDLGFPFTRDDFEEPEFYPEEYFPTQHQQYYDEPDLRAPEPKPKPEPEQVQKDVASQPKTESPKQQNNIQQSNTIDLGQAQPPVDENRNQRSMSAPPENRAAGKRFVSSINIPTLNTGGGDMGSRLSSGYSQDAPQSQPQQQNQTKSNERIIPIHIEGRDEPVIPNPNLASNVGSAQAGGGGVPLDKLFGQKPSNFTQFLNRGEPQGTTQEDLRKQHQFQEDLKRQQDEAMRQQYQKQQQEYQQQQQEHFQKQQQAPQQQQQQQQQQAQQPSLKPTPFELIQNIQKDVLELMSQVENFAGKPRDKHYLYLDEMLTRNLLKLDNIETEGKDTIRQARKEAIKCIEECIRILDTKANSNEAKEKAEQSKETSEPVEGAVDKMETENKEEKPTEESKEETSELIVGGVARSGSAVAVEDKKESAPMEVENAGTAEPTEVQKTEEISGEKSEINAVTEENLNASSQSQPESEVKDKSEKKKVKKKAEKK